MNTKYKIALFIILAGFSSCKKWLDVQPKTQVESDANFKTETGFQDALTGVYLNMATPALYGKELSYGFIDVIGKNYNQFTNGQNYLEDSKYNYTNAATKTRIDAIWNGSYNTIANINNLIENIEKADRKLFSESNYDVIKAEAYGLRAFNHFDLLRLFAPSPISGGENALAIPYRDKFSTEVVKQSTVGEVLNKIIADLNIAAGLLIGTDPIVAGTTVPTTTTGYLRDRHYKFNYYAVKALMARVYLYKGDKVNALACAREVINSLKFPATPVNQITSGNRLMSTEVIFDLYLNSLAIAYDSSFPINSATGMYFSDAEWKIVYETTNGGSSDYRYLYQIELVSGKTYSYSIKFRPSTNTATIAMNRLPLMRVSEMYYIAAESLAQVDGPAAIDYLNTVRRNRNLLNLANNLPADQIQNEIFKEYRKDFITEGQLFYYYKRLNINRIEFNQTPTSDAVYVLPKPDDEIVYGSIK